MDSALSVHHSIKSHFHAQCTRTTFAGRHQLRARHISKAQPKEPHKFFTVHAVRVLGVIKNPSLHPATSKCALQCKYLEEG